MTISVPPPTTVAESLDELDIGAYYFHSTRKLDSLFLLVDNWLKASKDLVIIRKGDERLFLKIFHRKNGLNEGWDSYVFNLALGGTCEQFEQYVKNGRCHFHRVEFKKVDGVIVPIRALITKYDQAFPQVSSVAEVELFDLVVNPPLGENLSIVSLPLKDDASVMDSRVGGAGPKKFSELKGRLPESTEKTVPEVIKQEF